MLEVKAINKSYGKKQVLFDVDCRFEHGVYGLLGPNGAGKSTLIQIMTGNLTWDSGEVLYNGKGIRKGNDTYFRELGYVPQLQGMYEQFSAYDFLVYMAVVKGIQKSDIKQEVRCALETVGLWEEAGRKLAAYSGGMKQRVLIAQALMGNPKVLIMDEPTAGLDPKERIKIRNYISRIAGEKTVIIATHVVSDVDTIAKEVLLLGNGRVIRQGSINSLCAALDGQVYERCVQAGEIEYIERRAVISNIQELPDGKIKVRYIDCHKGEEKLYADAVQEAPNLQEVYLSTFSKEKGEGRYADKV